MVKDHLGNIYKNKREMCDYWGITVGAYDSRIRRGKWSKKRALETPTNMEHVSKEVKDHLGNTFPTIKAMCEHYGLTYQQYKDRKKLGWSLKDILEKPLSAQAQNAIFYVKDHLGNEFESIQSMCDFWKIKRKTYEKRKALGWNTERIFTTPIKRTSNNGQSEPVTDHLGNKFTSISAMCRFYNINRRTFLDRINKGANIKDALSREAKPNCKYTDCFGNTFSSFKAMTKHYCIDKTSFQNYIRKGWSEEKIINARTIYIYTVRNRFGDKFDIIKLFLETPKNVYWLCKDKESGEEHIMTYNMLEQAVRERQ